jgi:hypothetical protein
MKYIIGIILSVFTGIFIGFFGALLSVFSDGAVTERLIYIALVLLVYFAASGIFGFLLSRYSWKWGLYVGVPAILILGYYSRAEFNIYYFIYMVLILTLSCLGSWAGSRIKRRSAERRRVI